MAALELTNDVGKKTRDDHPQTGETGFHRKLNEKH